MPLIYRGILLAPGGLPVVGDAIGDELGVRNADVVTTLYNGVPWVAPTNAGAPQGTSVAPGSGCNLPPHRRPQGPPWNGTNNKAALRVWQLDTNQLVPNELQYVPDPALLTHGFLSPAGRMPLQEYRDYVHSTAPLWTIAPAPPQPCAGAGAEGVPVDVEERAALVDATASGGDVEALVAELRSANAAGTGRAALIAELTAGVERAEDDDAAEVLRTVLDRVTGFCSPHARVELTD
ncbi:hypothetical protein [Lentzea sp. NPDC003310]|uniref:hypothetical protein n=1 Tax=Lentzea sp. NPDC003310 TaxID=3154447 RepID=UPI0033BC83F3